jgi:acyl transferase domain-containing protein
MAGVPLDGPVQPMMPFSRNGIPSEPQGVKRAADEHSDGFVREDSAPALNP